MCDQKLTEKDQYVEGCNALRNYSEALRNIRTLAVIQGLIVLGVVAILIQDGLFLYSFFIAIFGLAFSMMLFNLHEHYFNNFWVILEIVIKLENEKGPWRGFVKEACKRGYLNFSYKVKHHYAPFVLLVGTLFIIILFISFWESLYNFELIKLKLFLITIGIIIFFLYFITYTSLLENNKRHNKLHADLEIYCKQKKKLRK